MKRTLQTIAFALLLASCAAAQAAKTHVVDYIRDGAGNPVAGKVTFILTQKSVTNPDGLVIASPSVSAVLDAAGKFDVWLYPSAAMSPTSYYQAYVQPAAGGQTFLGVYNIPASGSIITLSPNQVMNAALAAQYTFASQAAVLALSQNISQATLAQLTFPNIVSVLGYVPVNPASLGTMAIQNANNVNVTGGTATNLTLINPSVIGVGSSSGIANNGNTTIAAGVGGSGGRVSVQTHGGLERIGVEDDGTVTIPKLVVPTAVPAQWQVSKYAGNPLTPTTGGGDLSAENYVPSPVHVGSDTWVYKKGTTSIYVCKMTNGVPPCVEQGAVLTPGASGAWDSANVINPYALYDSANATIHIYYSGRNSSGIEQVGHATCLISDPRVCTKDPANPIITTAQAQTALGIPTMRFVNITAAAKINGTLTFYGFATDFNINNQPGTVWRIFRATGTFNAPVIAGAVAGFPANTTRLPIIYDLFQPPAGHRSPQPTATAATRSATRPTPGRASFWP